MKLKSIRCPNCNGPVKQIGDRKYVCESCGTSFMADYDQEDVEMQRIKAESELKQKRLDAVHKGMEHASKMQRNAFPRKLFAIIFCVIAAMVMISIITTIGFFVNFSKRAKDYQPDYDATRQSMEEQAKQAAEEAQKLQEEAQKRMQAALAKPKYVTSTDELLADAIFVENAKAAMIQDAKDTSFLVWTNYFVDGDPEIVKTYLLVAKDENAKVKNQLICVLWVNWYAEYTDDNNRRDYFPIYKALRLSDLSVNEDGTIKTNYSPDNVNWHSETPRNQMFWGYADYDQLIRECILAQSDYNVFELDIFSPSEEEDDRINQIIDMDDGSGETGAGSGSGTGSEGNATGTGSGAGSGSDTGSEGNANGAGSGSGAGSAEGIGSNAGASGNEDDWSFGGAGSSDLPIDFTEYEGEED